MQDYSGIIAFVILIVALCCFLRYEALHEEDEEEVQQEQIEERISGSPLDINDEDATVASLIASIQAHNETGKNVRVVSIREVK